MDLRVKDRVLEILITHGQLTRENIGMSSERLERITELSKPEIDDLIGDIINEN